MKKANIEIEHSRAIHVWVISTSPRFSVGSMLNFLSASERKAARGFRDEPARKEYVFSRFFLGLLASLYLRVGRGKIAIRKNGAGRPWLANPESRRKYRLNVSVAHCSGALALAFSRKARLGIDIESYERTACEALAVKKHFKGAECLLEGEKNIWDCWVRKEAILKGLGVGLGGLRSLQAMPENHHLIRTDRDLWTVISVPMSEDFSLACASTGVDRKLKVRVGNPYKKFRRSY